MVEETDALVPVDVRSIDISLLIRSMEEVLNGQQGGPSQPMDEISCLTEYSMPLSDVYEVGENGERS